jgi:subtilisin-like proprotein convertase family protein
MVVALGEGEIEEVGEVTKLRMAALSVVAGAIALLPASAGATAFSNPNPIVINDYPISSCSTGPDAAHATPYPSSIAVSNSKGFTTKVTATLNGFTHDYPGDVRMLLSGPLGQTTELYNEAGGSTTATNLTITFDDAAATTLPNPLVSGTFRPSQTATPSNSCETPATTPLPAPAPQGLYGTALAAFNGTNPNGTWNLYVIDDAGGDSGFITSGWSLNVDAVPPAQCKPLRKNLKRLKKHHAPHKKIAKKKRRLRQLGC